MSNSSNLFVSHPLVDTFQPLFRPILTFQPRPPYPEDRLIGIDSRFDLILKAHSHYYEDAAILGPDMRKSGLRETIAHELGYQDTGIFIDNDRDTVLFDLPTPLSVKLSENLALSQILVFSMNNILDYHLLKRRRLHLVYQYDYINQVFLLRFMLPITLPTPSELPFRDRLCYSRVLTANGLLNCILLNDSYSITISRDEFLNIFFSELHWNDYLSKMGFFCYHAKPYFPERPCFDGPSFPTILL